MSQMQFFRTPVLAGNTTSHQSQAVIRGSLRRSDPDMSSAVPYFPGAVTGGTLTLQVDDVGAVSVTFTGAGIATVISDINTAFSAAGSSAKASDADGCVEIKSSTVGASSQIAIDGGTAAALIGFDNGKFGSVSPSSNSQIFSVGGEVAGTPEARVGNPFGTAFLSSGENLTAQGVNRGFHALSSNIDVLYADLARSNVVIKRVGGTGGDPSRIFFDGESAVYTGYRSGLNVLSGSSTPRDLAPYFFLIDEHTKLPAKSRVVGIIRGTVVGLPPYANVTAWSGPGADGNILGVLIPKVTATAITSITGGRTVYCASADFSNVSPGDGAEISGATNTDTWSNNGRKWIVESVIDVNTITLRPMSHSELQTWGQTFEQRQPIVSLQSQKGALQSYGNIAVYSGPFYSPGQIAGPTFATLPVAVIDPPAPPNAAYSLYAAVASSVRDAEGHTQHGAMQAVRELASNLDPVDNWILSGLDASLLSGNCYVAQGYVRWHGKTYFIPNQSIEPAAFSNGTNYVYWDEATSNVAVSTNAGSWAKVLEDSYLNYSGKGHLIAMVVKSAGVLTGVVPGIRRRRENALTITVGAGGQFKDLASAANYVSRLGEYYGERLTDATASGAYPHFEIVLVSDLTLSSDVSFTLPTTIRGVHPRVLLALGNTNLGCHGNYLELRDFCFSSTNEAFVLLGGEVDVGVAKSVVLKNLKQLSGSVGKIVSGSWRGLESLSIENCTFNVRTSICSSNGTTGSKGVDRVLLRDSVFNYAVLGAPQSPHIISRPTLSDRWDGDALTVLNCTFGNSWGNGAATDNYPVFVHTTSSSSVITVRDVQVSLANYESNNATSLFTCPNAATAVFENLVMTQGKVPIAISGGAGTVVKDCVFRVNNAITALSYPLPTAIRASYVGNCTVTHLDRDSSGLTGAAITTGASNSVIENNRVIGPFLRGIINDGNSGHESAVIQGNTVDLTGATNATHSGIASWAIDLNGNAAGDPANHRVIGNSILMTARSSYQYAIAAVGIRDSVISENIIKIRDPEIASSSQYGITATSSSDLTIVNNSIEYVGSSTANIAAIEGISANYGQRLFVSGNSIKADPSGSFAWIGITASDMENSTIANNRCSIGLPFYGSAYSSNIIRGNTFLKSSTNAATTSGPLSGNVSDNVFGLADAATAHPVTIRAGTYVSNVFSGNVTVEANTASMTFTDNSVSGNFAGGTMPAAASKFVFAQNSFGGTFGLTSSTNTHKVEFKNNSVTSTLSITLPVSGTAEVEFVGNSCAGNITGLNAQILRVSDNTLKGTTTSTAYQLHCDNNITSGNNAYTQTCTGESRICNNAFSWTYSIAGSGTSGTGGDVLFSSNSVVSSVTIRTQGSDAIVTDNAIGASLVVSKDALPGSNRAPSVVVANTSVGSDLTVYAEKFSAENNKIAGDLDVVAPNANIQNNSIGPLPTGTTARVLCPSSSSKTYLNFIGNFVGGATRIELGNSTATSYLDTATIANNVFRKKFGLLPADNWLVFTVVAKSLNFHENMVYDTNYIDANVFFGAWDANICNNSFVNTQQGNYPILLGAITADSSGANGMREWRIQNNTFLYSKLKLEAETAITVGAINPPFIEVTGNRFDALINPLEIVSPRPDGTNASDHSGYCRVSNNTISTFVSADGAAVSLVTIQSYANAAPLLNVEFCNNTLSQRMSSSPTFTVANTWSLLSVGKVRSIKIQDNKMYKPSNGTLSGFVQTVNYLKLGNPATQAVIQGNMLMRGNMNASTIGPNDVHKGGGYPTSATPYTETANDLTIAE